jgi:hypothetical protein
MILSFIRRPVAHQPAVTDASNGPPADRHDRQPFPAGWMTRMRFLMSLNGGGPQPDHELYAEMERS